VHTAREVNTAQEEASSRAEEANAAMEGALIAREEALERANIAEERVLTMTMEGREMGDRVVALQEEVHATREGREGDLEEIEALRADLVSKNALLMSLEPLQATREAGDALMSLEPLQEAGDALNGDAREAGKVGGSDSTALLSVPGGFLPSPIKPSGSGSVEAMSLKLSSMSLDLCGAYERAASLGERLSQATSNAAKLRREVLEEAKRGAILDSKLREARAEATASRQSARMEVDRVRSRVASAAGVIMKLESKLRRDSLVREVAEGAWEETKAGLEGEIYRLELGEATRAAGGQLHRAGTGSIWSDTVRRYDNEQSLAEERVHQAIMGSLGSYKSAVGRRDALLGDIIKLKLYNHSQKGKTMMNPIRDPHQPGLLTDY